jgi:hypothetical protein
MTNQVWYASYGSNLLRERFMAYIRGGRVPGAGFEQAGCTDKTPPKQDVGILILHRLYFAWTSAPWENAGVAFIREEKEDTARTLGRMYLISEDQFRDVVLQENGHRRMDVDLGMDLERTVEEGSSVLPGLRYGSLLHLGQEQGYPIFTFTASWEDDQAPINPPGTKYLEVITRGLKEAYRLTNEGVVDYLRNVPGIPEGFTEAELARIVAGATG